MHKQLNKKLNKLDFIKIKHLYFKGHHQQSENAAHRLGKIFLNHICDNELISRIYKKTLKMKMKTQPTRTYGTQLRQS
jgi:hypothetical protein